MCMKQPLEWGLHEDNADCQNLYPASEPNRPHLMGHHIIMTSEAGTVLRNTPSSHTSGVVLWDAHASPLPGVTTHGDLWLLGRFGK